MKCYVFFILPPKGDAWRCNNEPFFPVIDGASRRIHSTEEGGATLQRGFLQSEEEEESAEPSGIWE